jgi:hypothetical protein
MVPEGGPGGRGGGMAPGTSPISCDPVGGGGHVRGLRSLDQTGPAIVPPSHLPLT